MFTDGFSAYINNDEEYRLMCVYRMNETLFDYFCVGNLCTANPETTDDGTIIRVGDDEEYAEFNRDTGIGVYYYRCEYPDYMD